MLYHLLNYFNTFKYEMISNIDNAFYLINIYKLLEKVPLMFIHKESFNYLNEKNIKIQFENIFGEKISIKDTTLNIKLSENEEKNPKLADKGSKKKSSYDLEDDEDSKSNIGEAKKEIKITEKKSEVEYKNKILLIKNYLDKKKKEKKEKELKKKKELEEKKEKERLKREMEEKLKKEKEEKERKEMEEKLRIRR